MDCDADVKQDVYEWLFARCPPLVFPKPWDFLTAPPCCRAPIPYSDRASVLAELHERFPESVLSRSGVLEYWPGAPWPPLPRVFSEPQEAIIALRDAHGKLVALRTARRTVDFSSKASGTIPEDHWTQQRLAETGILIVTGNTHEAALLRALDLPAVYLLESLDAAQSLQSLNSAFDGQAAGALLANSGVAGSLAGPPKAALAPDTHGAANGTSTNNQRGEGQLGSGPPVAALMGWSLLDGRLEHSQEIVRLARYLTDVRRHLELPLRGIQAWRLGKDQFDNLCFRLRYRDPDLIRRLLLSSLQRLEDLSVLQTVDETPSEPPPAEAYATHHAGFVQALTTFGPTHYETNCARNDYERWVQKHLIERMHRQALEQDDPVAVELYLEIAHVCERLRWLSPRLAALQEYDAQALNWQTQERRAAGVLEEYLKLLDRLGKLIRTFQQWRWQ